MKKIDEKELHELFKEYKERNQMAYNKLYEKYNKLVYGIAFSIMKNKEDSEDITNEVFTKIYKLDKEKLPVSNEASWLFTVTRNECFSTLRKSRQNICIDEIYEVPSKSQEIQEIIDTEYYNKLISGLSEQEKTIISLKILSNFTFSKISQVMNIPIGTVQWKYYKAINSLKISVGGLIGATIAFALVFLRREKISNEKPYTNKGYKEKDKVQGNNNNDLQINEEIEKQDTIVNKSSEAQENSSSQVQENISSEIQKNNNSDVQESDKSLNSEIVYSTTPLESKTTDNKNIFDAFTITASIVGIIFLIIFIIFFKKYQQKLKKKTSK